MIARRRRALRPVAASSKCTLTTTGRVHQACRQISTLHARCVLTHPHHPPYVPRKKLRAIRQHVNPLSSLYQRPVDLPEGWVEAAFAKPGLPFHIDIGSARGRFCVDMAREYPHINFLGLEIRRPCVEEAFKKMEKYDIKDNVHFLALNANVDIDRVVADVQQHSQIVRYSVQFPDPHFKAKHKKRRMVQPALVAAMCRSLQPEGGEVLIQSDVEEVAASMREAFAEDPLVTDACAPGKWMPENPLKVPTEREKLTLSRGDPVYRTVFRRNNVKAASPPTGGEGAV